MVFAVFAVFLSGAVVLMALKLREKNSQLKICRERIREEMEAAKEQAKEKEMELIWDRINAIHLYAALSKEETRSRSVREKQEAILRIAEQLLEQSREQE